MMYHAEDKIASLNSNNYWYLEAMIVRDILGTSKLNTETSAALLRKILFVYMN